MTETLTEVLPGKLYRKIDAARLLGVHPATLSGYLRTGKIVATLNGKILGAELLRIGGVALAVARTEPLETRAERAKRNAEALARGKSLIHGGNGNGAGTIAARGPVGDRN